MYSIGSNYWTTKHSEQCSSPLYLIYNPNMFTVLQSLRQHVRHSLSPAPLSKLVISQSYAISSRIHLPCFFSVPTWSNGPRSLPTCSPYSAWRNRAPSQNSIATYLYFCSTSSLRYRERSQIKPSSLHERLTLFDIHGMPA